jgi:hypothetical protein
MDIDKNNFFIKVSTGENGKLVLKNKMIDHETSEGRTIVPYTIKSDGNQYVYGVLDSHKKRAEVIRIQVR